MNQYSMTDKITDYIHQTLEISKTEKTNNTHAEKSSYLPSKDDNAKNTSKNPEKPVEKKQRTITINGVKYVYDL